MSRINSFKLGISSAMESGASRGWLKWVGRRNKLKEKIGTQIDGGHNLDFPKTDWARCVAILAEMKRQEKMKWKRESN